MCEGQHSSLYKDNLIEQVGGTNQFDFVILTYCEAVQDDPKLKRFFRNYNLKELMKLQKVLLDAAFLKTTPEMTDADVRNNVILKNYTLFEAGFNAVHFDRLTSNIGAM